MGAGAVKPVPKVSVEGCHAGGCEVGLALAQEAPDGQEGGLVPMRVRGPCVSPGICSLHQDPGRTVMFGRPSPVNSPQSRG